MSWNNRVNNNYREERPSTPIYALRKEGKLEEAYQLALRLYQQDSTDDDINKAFSWVLIDLCKKCISEQNLSKAQTYFNQLSSIQYKYEDEFVETIKKQIHFLKPKIDTNYSEIQKAEELSKNGNNKEALAIFKNLISQNRLTELHHESYGWVIYRYIKAEESNLSSVEVRTFLRDYMNLKNERPSMLHSMILSFALNYSKTPNNFKFYNFFLLWNPDNLRHEDLHDGHKDGKDIPSLISRICREFVNTNTEFKIEEFLSKIKLSKETVLDFFRETFFWNIFSAHKENKFSELWNLFEQYNNNYSTHGQSKWHSEILNLAERFMKENDEWRFLNFFKNWNPENLRNEDWKEIQKDKKTYNSLAVKCYIKCFNLEFNNKINNAFELIDSIKSQSRKNDIIDSLKESFFWQLFNLHKENKSSELWNLFELYNVNFSKYEQSKRHSDVLNLAERFMKENDEWRFLNFFKNWNSEHLRNDDWKETKKDEHTYKPLAIKAIKKAFEILKTQTSEQNSSWLIKPYETAIKLFPDDEWLLREKALLHFKNNELEFAIKIYKQLVLELADKHYVWQEFSDCIESDNSLKIGMLTKALSLEKNEDFLGDIHLDLARVLIDENLFENVLVELEAYKKHREIKGWKLSSHYEDLYRKASSVKQSLKDNRELYKKFIPFAENFAYADLDWTEAVLADKWKDNKGKERLTFTDGKTIEFAIGKNRFEVLRQSALGQIFKFKLHKQEIKKEVENTYSWLRKKTVTEYKHIPLIAEKSEKKHWEILEDGFAIVEYINKEKNIIHAITTDNKEVFFPQIKSELKIGDFVRAKIYTKKVKNEDRTELRQIQKIDKNSVISKFQTQIAIVYGVNEQKQLFHFTISSMYQGIVKYSETNLRPNEGDFIKLSFATKTDKDKKLTVKVFNIELTDETNPNLRKNITGLLKVKYKNGKYYDYDFEGDECEWGYSDTRYQERLTALRNKYYQITTKEPTYEELIEMYAINQSPDDTYKFEIQLPYDSDEEWLIALRNKYYQITKKEPAYEELMEMLAIIQSRKNEYFSGKNETDNFIEELNEKRNDNLLFIIVKSVLEANKETHEKSFENFNLLYTIAKSVLEEVEETDVHIKKTIINSPFPDFAFIDDYYVPKYLLEKNNIKSDCDIRARVVNKGDKWKVVEIEKI